MTGAAALTRGARRKLRRSVERRGVPGTMMHALLWPARRAALVLSPAYREARHEDRAFDRLHGVDTGRAFDAGWSTSLAGGSWRSAIGYNPMPVAPFHRAMSAVGIEPGRSVFVDFGAGKGRAMLLATHYPFRRVLGVELSATLQRIAAGNLRRYRPSERVCEDADVALADALDYPLPDDPLVLFFYDPFTCDAFGPLLERIRRSLLARPRAAWIVYRDPRCGAAVERAGFRRLEAGDARTAVYVWGGGS